MSSVQNGGSIGNGRFVEVGNPTVIKTRSRRPLAESLKPTKVAAPKPEPIKVAETPVVTVPVVVEAPKLEAPVPTPKSVTPAPPPARVSSNAQADAILARQRTAFARMLSERAQPAEVLEARLEREREEVIATLPPSWREHATVSPGGPIVIEPPPKPAPKPATVEDTKKLAERFKSSAPSPTKSPLTLATTRAVDGRGKQTRAQKQKDSFRQRSPGMKRDLLSQLDKLHVDAVEKTDRYQLSTGIRENLRGMKTKPDLDSAICCANSFAEIEALKRFMALAQLASDRLKSEASVKKAVQEAKQQEASAK